MGFTTSRDIEQRDAPLNVSSKSKLTVDGVPPGFRNAHGKGFNREIPLLNVERLRPKFGPSPVTTRSR